MIEKQKTTGFGSPCSEYAEASLSLDHYFLQNKASSFFMNAKNNYIEFGILKGDLLLIDRGRAPSKNSLIIAVISNNFTLLSYSKFLKISKEGNQEEGEDFIFGVLSSIHRKF